MFIKRIIFLLMLFQGASYALKPLVITNARENYNLGTYLEFFEDKDKNLTINDISSEAFQNKFQKSQMDVLNFGVTDSAVWVRFQIQNNKSANKNLLLLDFLHIDKAELFYKNENGQFIKRISGDSVPLFEREIEDRNILFRLAPRADKPVTYYMRFEMQGTMALPLQVVSRASFNKRLNKENYALGMYYGAIICLIFYNLFIFIFLRDRNYLYYISYLFFFMLVMMANYGFGLEHIWYNYPKFHNYSVNVFLPPTLFFMALFSRNALNLSETIPWANKTLKIFLYFMIFLFLMSPVLSVALGLVINWLSVIALFLFLYIISFIAYYRNYSLAKYYIAAWTLFFTGTIMLLLRNFDILPVHFLTEYTMLMGSSAEHILLSLVLAKRVETLRERNETLSRELTESRLKALQNRMSPHFLFNTLNAIYAMMQSSKVNINPAKKAVIQLADTYHFLTDYALKPLIAFEDEWNFLMNYLEIMKTRFKDRLSVEIQKSGKLNNVLLPPLTIQPIAENYFKHGLKKTSDKKLFIKIFTKTVQDGAEIQVIDSGSGLKEGNIFLGTIGGIKTRLEYNYTNVKVELNNVETGGVSVVIIFYGRRKI
ncbi:MAG: histidine kinase [Spirochaetia bacterium]|nr:histidine kinase [Spirochaetia bacterium]